MNGRISIQITSRDRATEVAVLLQALRTQTEQNFDIIVLDDASGTPLMSFYFIQSLLNRLKLEGHKIKTLRNDFSQGVCAARQRLIDEDDFENEFSLRLDDDCIPEPDYLEKLINVIEAGYDIATGVIPSLAYPEFKREVKYVKPIICKHTLDKEGNLIENKDELGFCYIEQEIIQCHQFRTNCLFKSEILKKVKYPQTLTKVGFREELWISFQAIILGYKIAAHTGAIAYHFQTPSGGCRDQEYGQKVQLDEETTRAWIKKQFEKHGNFLEAYHEKN